MSSTVAPNYFAARQALVRSVPLWVTSGVLVGGWYLFGPKANDGWPDVVTSVGAYLFYILATGGIAIGYFGWWLGLHLKGMMSTPRHPWKLGLKNDVLVIATGRVETHVRLDSIRSFTLLSDDNWDQLKGMEDCTLVARLGRCSRILIPGSSTNFKEVLAAIRSTRNVEIELVE